MLHVNIPECFLIQKTGIEITLTRSLMATGFCFGRAENLENYFFFARMASEEFDLNLYFKKSVLSAFGWSCLVLLSDFAVRHEALARRAWQRDKNKASDCLLLNAHSWGRRSRHTLQLVFGVLLQRWKERDRQPCWIFFYFSTHIYPCIIVLYFRV